MSSPNKIQVDGLTDPVDYNKVKRSVVCVDGVYYFKNSKKLILYKGAIILKTDEFVELDHKIYGSGIYELKVKTVETEPFKQIISLNEAFKIDDKYYRSREVVSVGNKQYHNKDPRIFCCPYSGMYDLKKNGLPHKSILVNKSCFRPCFFTNKMIFTEDENHIRLYRDGQVSQVIVSGDAPELKKLKRLIIGSYSSYDEYPTVAFITSEEATKAKMYYDEHLGCYWKKKDDFEIIIRKVVAKSYFNIPGDIRGAEVYYRPQAIPTKANISKTRGLVGGLNYSFGIEFETSNGIIHNSICEALNLTKVGDGSTRNDDEKVIHYEYVTGILHGSEGVKKAIKSQSVIRSMTEFNPLKCSTHIHVGGIKGLIEPDFNREFSAYAVNLGLQIESTLSLLVPEYRHPKRNRYCGSIKGFNFINVLDKNSINSGLASFIFDRSRLNKDVNKKTVPSRWVSSRYKWLNLVNAGSGSNLDTIEFRIFPATDNEDYLRLYILISLAFVDFIENHKTKIVSKHNTVFSLLEDVYSKKSPKLYRQFIEPTLGKLLTDTKLGNPKQDVLSSYFKDTTTAQLKSMSTPVPKQAKSVKKKVVKRDEVIPPSLNYDGISTLWESMQAVTSAQPRRRANISPGHSGGAIVSVNTPSADIFMSNITSETEF